MLLLLLVLVCWLLSVSALSLVPRLGEVACGSWWWASLMFDWLCRGGMLSSCIVYSV